MSALRATDEKASRSHKHTKTGSRKEAAIEFLRLASSGKVREAFRAHAGPGFRHHNPFFHGDAESLMAAMEENAAQNPSKKFELQHALEDGNLVALHGRVRLKFEDLGTALVHIFRFEDDRIVELWDLGQPVPEDSPNENGMF
jgi:predicted SnoaL-like aldol condensation-catalyzing enzyme